MPQGFTMQRSPSGKSKQIGRVGRLLFLQWLWNNIFGMFLEVSTTGDDISEDINELKKLMDSLFKLVVQNCHNQLLIEIIWPEIIEIDKLVKLLKMIVVQPIRSGLPLETDRPKGIMKNLSEHAEKVVRFFEGQGKDLNIMEDIFKMDLLTSLHHELMQPLDQQAIHLFMGEAEKERLEAKNKNHDSTQAQKALKFLSFLAFVFWSSFDIPLNQRAILLVVCCSYLCHQVLNSSTEFGFQNTASSNAEGVALSFGGAFTKSYPVTEHIAKFMLCYFLNIMLGLGFPYGLQTVVMIIVIPAPVFYFPQLARKASGIYVACGHFKVPIIWFASLEAFGLFLLSVFLILLILYLSRRYIYESTPTMDELKDALDELSEIMVE